MKRSDQFSYVISMVLMVSAVGATSCIALPIASRLASGSRAPAAGTATPPTASADELVSKESLVGYEQASATMMPLEGTLPIRFKQQRDRCYRLILRVQPGSVVARPVLRDGLTVGFGSIEHGEHVRMMDIGGSAEFCPLERASGDLLVYYVLPRNRRLGRGALLVEVWSKKMSAAWIRKEREERRAAARYARDYEARPVSPQCRACSATYDECRQLGRTSDDDQRCWARQSHCFSAHRCLAY